MKKKRSITVKISVPLFEKIESLKNSAYDGNRSALVIKALENFILACEGGDQVRASPTPQIAEAALTSLLYIRDVLLQDIDANSPIRKEVDRLCHLLN